MRRGLPTLLTRPVGGMQFRLQQTLLTRRSFHHPSVHNVAANAFTLPVVAEQAAVLASRVVPCGQQQSVAQHIRHSRGTALRCVAGI
jgi:hypothetical protein